MPSLRDSISFLHDIHDEDIMGWKNDSATAEKCKNDILQEECLVLSAVAEFMIEFPILMAVHKKIDKNQCYYLKE